MHRKVAIAAVLAAAQLAGCAGGGSHVAALASSAAAIDVLAGGAILYAAYAFSQTPAWTARASQADSDPKLVRIELEKSMFSEGGEGAASMTFRLAAKRWCAQSGVGSFETLEFVEFYEPRLLGAARRASGEARCL